MIIPKEESGKHASLYDNAHLLFNDAGLHRKYLISAQEGIKSQNNVALNAFHKSVNSMLTIALCNA